MSPPRYLYCCPVERQLCRHSFQSLLHPLSTDTVGMWVMDLWPNLGSLHSYPAEWEWQWLRCGAQCSETQTTSCSSREHTDGHGQWREHDVLWRRWWGDISCYGGQQYQVNRTGNSVKIPSPKDFLSVHHKNLKNISHFFLKLSCDCSYCCNHNYH